MKDSDDLILNYLDGTLDADQAAELRHLIDASPEARQRLLLHASVAEFLDEAVMANGVSASAGSPPMADKALRKGFPRWIPWGIALLGGIIAFFALFDPTGDRGGAAPGADAGVAALLVNDAGAKFAREMEPDGFRFLPGQYRINSGAIHLRFTSGTDLFASAPAEFRIDDALHIALLEGNLRFYVPPAARGFTVSSGALEFIDRGTEFGLAKSADADSCDLHVFEGRVDARHRGGSEAIASVRGGEAVRVASGGQLTPLGAPNSSVFLSGEEIARASGTSPVPAETLIGHWTFDEGSGNTAADSSAKGNTATVAGRGGEWIEGKAGGAYSLHSTWLEIEDSSALRVTGAVTVSAWVKPHSPSSFGVISGIEETGGSERDMFTLKTDGDDFPRWEVIGSDSNASITGSITLSALSDATADGWVHLVGVYDPEGQSAALYANGALVGSTKSVPASIQFLPGGAFQIGHNASDNKGNFLNAAVDDIQVYARALTPEEISRIFAHPGTTAPSR